MLEFHLLPGGGLIERELKSSTSATPAGQHIFTHNQSGARHSPLSELMEDVAFSVLDAPLYEKLCGTTQPHFLRVWDDHDHVLQRPTGSVRC